VPHPAGLEKPNPFGLYDILGNGLEWVHGRFHPYGAGDGSTAPVTDPMGDLSPDGGARVYRGGDWNGYERYLRAGATVDSSARWSGLPCASSAP
jgi:sulfatase modifying factor 1